LRRARPSGTQFGFALGLELLELPDHQAQPLVFARDLFLEPLRPWTAVTGAQAGKAFDERAIKRS
jgi:hypothetical protein